MSSDLLVEVEIPHNPACIIFHIKDFTQVESSRGPIAMTHYSMFSRYEWQKSKQEYPDRLKVIAEELFLKYPGRLHEIYFSSQKIMCVGSEDVNSWTAKELLTFTNVVKKAST